MTCLLLLCQKVSKYCRVTDYDVSGSFLSIILVALDILLVSFKRLLCLRFFVVNPYVFLLTLFINLYMHLF